MVISFKYILWYIKFVILNRQLRVLGLEHKKYYKKNMNDGKTIRTTINLCIFCWSVVWFARFMCI